MSVNNIGCTPSAGYLKPITCFQQIAGVTELYLMKASWLSAYYFDTTDKITSISYTPGSKFYKFELINQTASYEEKENEDSRTGAIFWNQNLNIVFAQNSARLRKQLLQLMRDNTLIGIFKDNNNRYWLIGKDNYLRAEATIQTGQNFGDLNGQKITINGAEQYPAYEVAGNAITYSTTYIFGGGDVVSDTGIPSGA